MGLKYHPRHRVVVKNVLIPLKPSAGYLPGSPLLPLIKCGTLTSILNFLLACVLYPTDPKEGGVEVYATPFQSQRATWKVVSPGWESLKG